MGHGIRHKKRRDNPRKRDDRDQKGGYKDIVRENDWLEKFYRSHEGLCPPEEFDEMIKYMKEDLPASFRITGMDVKNVTYITVSLREYAA